MSEIKKKSTGIKKNGPIQLNFETLDIFYYYQLQYREDSNWFVWLPIFNSITLKLVANY